jgi:hypothetical protein
VLTPKLSQEQHGAQFELSDDGVFKFASLGNQTDREVAVERTTRLLQLEVQRKARALGDRTIRLSNQPGWSGLVAATNLFSETIDCSGDELADAIATVWSLSVSLGGYLEQDEHARASPEGMVEPLEVDVLRSLRDLVTTAAPWVRRFPTARLLDNEARDFSDPHEALVSATSFLLRVKQAALIRADQGKVVEVALDSGKGDTVVATKARGWGVRSMRNAALAALAIVGIAASGYTDEIGNEIAKHSEVAHRIEQLVIDSEKELLDLLSHLPADIRAVLKSALDLMGKQSKSSAVQK